MECDDAGELPRALAYVEANPNALILLTVRRFAKAIVALSRACGPVSMGNK